MSVTGSRPRQRAEAPAKSGARGNSSPASMSEDAPQKSMPSIWISSSRRSQLQRAVASRREGAEPRAIPRCNDRASSLEVNFQPQKDRSLLKEMRTQGGQRSRWQRHVRAQDPARANKQLTADRGQPLLARDGRDLEPPEAIGNAELMSIPSRRIDGRPQDSDRAALRRRLLREVTLMAFCCVGHAKAV